MTFQICLNIFKDAIELPCKHDICQENLNEETKLKAKRIKCIQCQQEFDLNRNDEFKSNDLVLKMLKVQVFLSDDEF